MPIATKMSDSHLRKYQRMLTFKQLDLELDAKANSKIAKEMAQSAGQHQQELAEVFHENQDEKN